MRCLSKKYILIVTNLGQANEQRLKLLLDDIFNIKGNGYQTDIDEYESNKYYFKVFRLTDGTNQNRNDNEIRCLKSRIKTIICLEHFNPRSNTLKGNLEELTKVFSAEELRKKLFVFCTFGTSTTPSSLEKLREEALDFNEMFRLIGLFDKLRVKPSRCFSIFASINPLRCFSRYASITPIDESEVSLLLLHSGIMPGAQSKDLSIEDVKILRKEYILKQKFNSKRVWILDLKSKWILNNISF